jgi:DNA-binding NtrC family response regulator
MTPVLLLMDDEPAVQHAFRRFFREPDVSLLTANTAEEGLRLFSERRPDAVILDLNLPDLPGMEVFHRLHERDPRVPVIFVTGQGTAQNAIEAMKLGAFDYLVKPLGLGQVRDIVGRAFQISRLVHVPAVPEGKPAPEAADVIVGRSPLMHEIYKAIGLVASQDINVLITGESGTGKELVARAVYQHSRRGAGAFLAMNCAAIPEALLESELFGHEKGAFTGADRQRIGKFEQCNGGTIFLDEIGDMTPLTQAKILRVLQEQSFERVGGSETIRTDVRVIAATNRNLEQMVEEGEFRRDLYYRLAGFAIALPPLRERLQDLPQLVEHFLRRFSREFGKEVLRVAPEALDLLRRYSWPGNVRELQSVLRQALLRAHGPVLLPDFLPVSLSKGEGGPAEASECPGVDLLIDEHLRNGSTRLYAEMLARIDHHIFTRVLAHTHGNQLRAARILGLTRGKLRSKLRALGILPDRSEWSSADHSSPLVGSG